jgi:hypothetical protein
MNIDEIESGKGLRFLPNPMKSPSEVFSFPGTPYEVKQRRVRARRERFKEGIELINRAIPGSVFVKKRMRSPGSLFIIDESSIKQWQL